MKKHYRISTALACLLIFTTACKKEGEVTSLPTPKIAQGEYDYLDFKLPQTIFGNLIDTTFFHNFSPAENQLTNEGATLGRVLFYDGHLSKNNLISCSSCHLQSKGFSDPAQFSTGFKLAKTTRNSMAISNLALQRAYFWDERATKLEEQVMMPVQNHIEMGIEKLEVLPDKLKHVPYYDDLFTAAFGDAEITEQRIRFALAQFLRSMVSSNSRYDKGLQDGFADFTDLEKKGMALFTEWGSPAGCANCHSGSLFDGWSRHNIGLDAEPTDLGDGNGFFKVPSLRNVAVTAPYMHDGRFNTLEEVVNHYDHGVQMNSFLDWALLNENGDAPRRLNLTQVEKSALVAFLKTLTDEQYLTDPKFSDPFN